MSASPSPIAAHLEPEILIVDEVLAVGDIEFQKKCLGRMCREVAGAGRTVLFVSHNMPAVEALCARAIRLADGVLLQDRDTAAVIAGYLKDRSARTNGTIETSRNVIEGLVLVSVRLSPYRAPRRCGRYPHGFSGGCTRAYYGIRLAALFA